MSASDTHVWPSRGARSARHIASQARRSTVGGIASRRAMPTSTAAAATSSAVTARART